MDDMEKTLFATLGKKPKTHAKNEDRPTKSKKVVFDIRDKELLELLSDDEAPVVAKQDGNPITSVLDTKRELASTLPTRSNKTEDVNVDKKESNVNFGTYMPSISPPMNRRRGALLAMGEHKEEDTSAAKADVVGLQEMVERPNKEETNQHNSVANERAKEKQFLLEKHVMEVEVLKEEMKSRVDALEQLKRERDEAVRRLSLAEKENARIIEQLKEQIREERDTKKKELVEITNNHRQLVESMQRQHLDELQRTKCLHREELESLKQHQGQTRSLSSLVEKCIKEISNTREEMREKCKDILQEICGKMEEQRLKLQDENKQEPQSSAGLMKILESTIMEREKRLEQDKCNFEQQKLHLQTRESVFMEEQKRSLQWLSNQREIVQNSKEEFLREQQLILTECYSQQQTVRRDLLHVQELERQLILDKEKLDSKQREQQNTMLLCEERLSTGKEVLERERKTIEGEKLQVEALKCDLKKREEEVERSLQVAWEMYISSQHSLKKTQTLQDCLYKREVELKQQEEAVLDKQKLIAMENIALLREKRRSQDDTTYSPPVHRHHSQSPTLQHSLEKLKYSQSVRDAVSSMEQDEAILEEENKFLNSIQK